MEKDAVHLRSLTSLRFVAAILVVAFHLSLFTRGLDPWNRLVAPGYVGVTFFFVLSGFVLTCSWDLDASPGRFFRRRFARVYPVHLLFIAVAIVTSPAPRWDALPANVLLLQSWSPDDSVVRSFSGVSWSLSCELFFYLAFPFIVRRLWGVRRPLVATGLLLGTAFALGLALQRQSSDWGLLLFHLPAFRMVEFVCGALTAVAVMRGWTSHLRVRGAAMSVLVSFLLVLLAPAAIGYRMADRWALTMAMVPSFIALIAACAAVDLTGAKSHLQGRALVYLGRLSFCVYMVHPWVIVMAAPILATPSLLGATCGALLVIALVLVLSAVIYRTFERPLERRLRGEDQIRASDEPLEARAGTMEAAPFVPAGVTT